MKEMSYCQECGSELQKREKEGRERSYCPGCEIFHYKSKVPFAGVIVRNEGKFLAIERGIEPWKGSWSIPAGFMELEEEPEEAAARELREETGLEVKPKELELYDVLSTPHPRYGRNLGVIFDVDRYSCRGELSAGSEIGKLEFTDGVGESSPLLDRLDL